MPLRRDRGAALLASFLSLLAPAHAWAASYSREGLLRWSFDDVESRSTTRQRRSAWSQAYEYSVAGPLASPRIGEGRSSARFAKGIDGDLAANTSSPSRRILSWDFSGQLFRPEIRPFLRLRPAVSWNETEQAGASGQPPRTLGLNTWGFSGGGGWPGLFSLDVSRHFTRRKDPAAGFAVDELSKNEHETLTVLFGRMTLAVERQSGRIEDRLGTLPPRIEEWRTARLDGNYYDLPRVGLSALSFRSEYKAQRSEQTRQKDAVADLSLRSVSLPLGRWSHSASYSGLARRNFLPIENSLTQTAAVDSQLDSAAGLLRNTLSAGHTSGPSASRSLAESLSLSQNMLNRKLSLNESLSGSWSQASGSGVSLGDTSSLRMTFFPSPLRTFTGQWTMIGQAPRGGGGLRSHRGELSTEQSVLGRARVSGRYERSRARDYAAAVLTLSDTFAAQATASLLDGLDASAGYDLSYHKTRPGRNTNSHSTSIGAEYRAFSHFSMAARISWTSSGRDASLASQYQLGKTTFALFYQRRETGVYRSYHQLSASLTRVL